MASVPSQHDATDVHEHRHRESRDRDRDAAIASLRAHGERITEARRAVIDVLSSSHEHLSADQIVAALESSRPVVHRATVYRTMDVLADLGVVSHLHLPGEASVYHLVASPTGHEHLHAHCRVCAAVTVISGDALDVASVRITEETGFRLEALQSTLMGICADCTGRSASS